MRDFDSYMKKFGYGTYKLTRETKPWIWPHSKTWKLFCSGRNNGSKQLAVLIRRLKC